MNEPSKTDILQELMSGIRHYSNLRFAIFTVFFAITGGVLNTFFDCAFSAKNTELLWLFRMGGMLVTIAFWIFEAALDSNLSRLWSAVAGVVGDKSELLVHRQEWKGILVPFATHGIFAFSLVFWLFIAPGVYPCGI